MPPPREIPLDPDADAPLPGTHDDAPAIPPAPPAHHAAPAPHQLGLEKLEGRQESGRDDQDEAEEDEPA